VLNSTYIHTVSTTVQTIYCAFERYTDILGIVESLQSHFILTMSHWSSGQPVCFPSQGTQVQIPRGVLMWNRDSPVSVVSLHWWPRRDWSFLWPRLRRASSRTITRPSCWQCDNPTWSHTAFLSRFHSPVENLQSHLILTMFHWSSGLPFASCHKGPRFKSPGGYFVKPGFSC
jgi:hypothetical protein